MDTPQTLQAAIEFFSDPDRAHAYMVHLRWPDGVVTCPTCNQPNPRYLANQRRFECRKRHPRRQFSVKDERSGDDAARFAATLKRVTGRRVTFDELTGKEAVA